MSFAMLPIPSKNKLIHLFGIMTLLFFISCSSVKQFQEPDSKVFYKRDVSLEINGVKTTGVYAAPYAFSYSIKGTTRATIDFLRLETCHLERTAENLKKDFLYVYEPTAFELASACDMAIGAYDIKGQHAWGYVVFKRGEMLEAYMDCDGKTTKEVGVSICQAKVGLRQQLRFDEPVKMKSESEFCTPPYTTDDGRTWKYDVSRGNCQFIFYKNSKMIHRHVNVGYEDILIRQI